MGEVKERMKDEGGKGEARDKNQDTRRFCDSLELGVM